MKEIPLVGRVAAGRVALVDDEDYLLVMQYRWRVQEISSICAKTGRIRIRSGPYAMRSLIRNERWTTQYMHNLIMGALGIDHINHDGLDNRRKNLRPANASLNAANQQIRTDGISPYKGVNWHKGGNKWEARIQVNGRRIHLGFFNSQEEAAWTYDKKAAEAYGAYAYLNINVTD